MNIFDSATKHIEEEISNLDACRLALQRLPGEMPHVTSVCSSGTLGWILLSAPNSPESKKQTLDSLKERGWIVRKDWADQGSGNLRMQLYHPECSAEVEVFFKPGVTGATCKRQIVGYEQTPIYEITCMEAQPL